MTPRERAEQALPSNYTDVQFAKGSDELCLFGKHRMDCPASRRSAVEAAMIALLSEWRDDCIAKALEVGEKKWNEVANVAIAAAVEEERETCCKDMCKRCAEEMLVTPVGDDGVFHYITESDGTRRYRGRCGAAAIRARGK